MPKPLDQPIVAVWEAGFTDEELELAIDMMRAGGLATPGALIHAALYHFARQLELDVPIHVFDIGRRRRLPAQPVSGREAPAAGRAVRDS